jgi:hypothetical protein
VTVEQLIRELQKMPPKAKVVTEEVEGSGRMVTIIDEEVQDVDLLANGKVYLS